MKHVICVFLLFFVIDTGSIRPGSQGFPRTRQLNKPYRYKSSRPEKSTVQELTTGETTLVLYFSDLVTGDFVVPARINETFSPCSLQSEGWLPQAVGASQSFRKLPRSFPELPRSFPEAPLLFGDFF
jgi:hypothetical protein